MAALAVAAALVGCGQDSASRTPSASVLPLVPGAKIVVQAQNCDKGANAFCALQLVVVDSRLKNSNDLLSGEHRFLHARGWLGVGGDTGQQRAAESPGRKWRVTYATAFGDLQGIELGGIKRSRKITLALSRALFDRAAAISILLEAGPA
jgi:hypothetical protein